jgi:histidinol dehydrogenase
MKTYKNPNQKKWAELIKRPVINQLQLSKTVEEIVQDVSDNGDEALFKYTQRFDGVTLSKLEVREKEIENSIAQTPQSLKAAINIAYNNIKAFHMAQQRSEATVETMPGVRCWRKSVAIEKVGTLHPRRNSTIIFNNFDAWHSCSNCRLQRDCFMYATKQKQNHRPSHFIHRKTCRNY